MDVTTEPIIASTEPSLSHPFEWVWPMTFIAVLVALWIPWYLRALDVDIGAITWLLTVATGVHLLSAPAAARIRDTRAHDGAILALHALSFLVLGAVWIILGTMDVPLFVIFFAPPIIAAPMIRDLWGRAAAFGVALLVLLLAALLASPSLRWFGGQLGIPLGYLEPIARRLTSLGVPAEQNVAPTASAISLGLAAVALTALYAGASGFAAANRRTIEWLNRTIAALRKDSGLALELLQSSPLPEALVLPESARIVIVNDRFRSVFAAGALEVEGLRLTDLVKLQFPEALERLVHSGDGTVDGSCPGSDGRIRDVRVHVRRSKHEEANVARVSFQDRTAERQFEGALDTLEIILLVLGADETLVYANAAARSLFAEAEPGAVAASVLRHADLPNSWWRAPDEGSIRREIAIAGNIYRGKVFCRRPEGLAEPFTVIALTPASAP